MCGEHAISSVVLQLPPRDSYRPRRNAQRKQGAQLAFAKFSIDGCNQCSDAAGTYTQDEGQLRVSIGNVGLLAATALGERVDAVAESRERLIDLLGLFKRFS